MLAARGHDLDEDGTIRGALRRVHRGGINVALTLRPPRPGGEKVF
jgi:hypothetical protein